LKTHSPRGRWLGETLDLNEVLGKLDVIREVTGNHLASRPEVFPLVIYRLSATYQLSSIGGAAADPPA